MGGREGDPHGSSRGHGPGRPRQQAQRAHVGGVPDAVYQLLIDLDHEEEQEDDQHEQGAHHPPGHLPEDVGLVADHKLDVPVEPGSGGQRGWSPGSQVVHAVLQCHIQPSSQHDCHPPAEGSPPRGRSPISTAQAVSAPLGLAPALWCHQS